MKLWTTSGGILWLRRKGIAFRTELAKLEATAKERNCEIELSEIHSLLDQLDARRYGLWGVLDYTLLKPDRSALVHVFARSIFRVPYLAAGCLVVFIGISRVVPSQLDGIWLPVAVVYQCEIALIAIEGIFAYVTLGSYRRNYHMNFRNQNIEVPSAVGLIDEITVFVPVLISALLVNITAFCVAQVLYAGFSSAQVPIGDISDLPRLCWNAVYFVSTTLSTVGYGDITPQSWRSQMVTVSMHAQGLLLIVGMFSALISFGLRSVATNAGRD